MTMLPDVPWVMVRLVGAAAKLMPAATLMVTVEAADVAEAYVMSPL